MTRKVLLATIAALALGIHATAEAGELSSANQTKILGNVDAYASRMSEVALQIWAMPELGYLENQTTALLQGELKKAGFKVQTGVAGIPTSFIDRKSTRLNSSHT